ncbi:uncharacterized protein LOC129578668 isoform X1 [Sitodiplosis mosellana]|nr:uncharacterized protein LOC129578668 isoform X1 [Sitodiplosis mosellana]XP_055323530.1 uncharacterized protein LOC129578668 isoform X1 [Sitodiplosis mosellana]XP_055323531.1 uncharacterized protein LOC129578668 isoform X1 [Sitodiplosis mosellana]XP_055323532.1 uncharacterized protein LOC129578668 isoform X1 [Sitodiplosis mosellana]XP_055323533.1 uncharacterized protein LOC129578668 isoform X1 [Sitodiplosis mosellana]XP_055323534.1 uncharacterized protein LOC129578668 isoform X1 [Sitodiplosi
MAKVAGEKIVETPKEHDESATNGDTSKLEYSGLSEDTLCTNETQNKSIADEIAQDFNEDLDEHSAPVPSAKAIKREITGSHPFNDDDFPNKTLTTLETVKKPAQPNDSEEIEICPIETEEDEFEEEPILLEVVNEDEENKESEVAVKPVTYRKPTQIAALANDVRTKMQTPKMNNKTVQNDSIVTPNKPIPTPSAGTIEIPRELITSDASAISPLIINHIKTPLANSDDLIAILEGDDNGSANASVAHYELSLSSGNTNGEQKLVLTAEEEREIAMEQIMSLPKKKKGRPKLNPSVKAAREARLAKKPKCVALVNSLVSDWDEGKQDEATETEIVVEIRPQKKQAIVEPTEPTFRRSRIIKKKIIWDPDAPETAINYASLAHTSGAGPAKRPRKKKDSEPSEGNESLTEEVTLPSVPAPKKKKTSEIDKLLGDEGAANMLNSLHQGNNNNVKAIDGTSPSKIPRAKAIKVEPCNVQSTTPVTAKAKATKVKEAKEPSPQKQPQNANKKNVTPKSGVGGAAGKKRGSKTSDSWDYIYKSRPDDCMIIRRRSNSSYSSGASLNRTSIDLPNAPYVGDFDGVDNDHEPEMPPNKRPRSNKDKNFEFARPRAKKIGKPDAEPKYPTSFDEAKNSGVVVNDVFTNHKAIKNAKSDENVDFAALPIKLENGNDKDASFTQISLCRYENFTQIILQPDATDSKSLLTVQMLKEIETALHSLESDKTTKLVLLTSSADNFCGGVDYSSLVQSTGEKRRTSALDLAKKLNNFIQVLAAFKKPFMVYVKGLVNGLGARILPLFDVVWAESGASFSATVQDYGEIIEGTALLSATDKIDYNAKAKLLFLNEVMDAEEAKDCKIVTQVLKEGTADQRVLIECDKLATKSSLVLETFRLIQQQNVLPKLKDSLKIEQKQLLQQWTKSDFVEKIKAQQ